MQYLVTAEFVDPDPLLPPEQLVELIRQMLLPTHDALTNLKAQGKVIAGGFPVGERAAVFIFDADSNAELDSILQGLPIWGFLKIKATPLEDIENRRERDRQQAEQIAQTLRQ